MECYRHPRREGSYYCQKDGNYMCIECSCCHSPEVYCQYRTACVINLLAKEGDLVKCEDKDVNREIGKNVEKSVVTR